MNGKKMNRGIPPSFHAKKLLWLKTEFTLSLIEKPEKKENTVNQMIRRSFWWRLEEMQG